MSILIRQGKIEDSFACYRIFIKSLDDLGRRLGIEFRPGGFDDEFIADFWQYRRSLFEHLARTAENFWLAERDAEPIGYARSVLRGGMRELTEFFLLPGEQAAGIGKELLLRTFPAESQETRIIVATMDTRAVAHYLKLGLLAQFPISNFSCQPQALDFPTDLTILPATDSSETLAQLDALDKVVLGHERTADHQWLLSDREGFLYLRAGRVVGYAYIGSRSGPMALLDSSDFPAVLAHAETQAAKNHESFSIDIPLINRAALQFALQRGYKLSPFYTFFMADRSFGNFENYIFTGPTLFL